MELVLGAGTPVGRQLVDVLASRGPVRAWNGTGDLRRAMSRVEIIYSCGGERDLTTRQSWGWGPSPELATIVEAAELSGARRLVHLSTTQVYGPPIEDPFTENSAVQPLGPLARRARRDETLLLGRRGRIEVVVVRAAQLFGPGEPLTLALEADLARGPIWLPGRGQASRSFIHVRDAARALVAAAVRGRPYSTYLASGFISSWYELCVNVAARFGGRASVYRLPFVAAMAAALVRELAARPGQRCWPGFEVTGMLGRTHLVDDSVSRRELTWSPQICAFEEGVLERPARARVVAAAPSPPTPAPLPVRATSRRGRSRS